MHSPSSTEMERYVEPPAAVSCLHLQIFDLALELRSDSERCVRAVAGLPGRFVIDGATDRARSSARLTILTQSDNSYGSFVVISNGQAYPLISREGLD